MRIIIYIAIIYTFCISSILYGQSTIYKNYTTADGLSSNNVYSVIQDKRGYIWICSLNGINCFDGKNFISFNKTNGLPDNDVINLFEDGLGRIWVNSLSGEACYIKNNTIYTKKNDTALANIASNSYYRYVPDTSGFILFFDDKIIGIDNKGAISKLNIETLTLTKKIGQYFVSYHKGVIKLTKNRAVIDSFILPSTLKKEINISANPMQIINDSTLIINSLKSICTFQILDGKLRPKKILPIPYSIATVNLYKNELYITTFDKGIFKIVDTSGFIKVNYNIVDEYNYKNILIDKFSNQWIATEGQGIVFIPKQPVILYDNKRDLPNKYITALHGDKDNIYIGFNDGKIYSKNFSTFKNIYNVSNPITRNAISNIICKDDHLYFITNGDIVSYHQRTKAVKAIKAGSMKDMSIGDNGKLYFGTNGSAFSLDKYLANSRIIFSGRTTAIEHISDSTLLIGTNKNAFLVKGTIPFKIFKKDNSVNIADLACLRDSILIIATQADGIFYGTYGNFKQLTTKNGLVDNNCRSVFIDHQDRIWVATFQGISMIDLRNGKLAIKSYNAFQGLINNDIHKIYVYGDSMYIASTIGLMQLNTELWQDANIPVNSLAQIKINNMNMPINKTDFILKNSECNLEFSLGMLDYECMGNFKCAYKLAGFSDKWDTISSNKIRFLQLPPGRYKLVVAIKNCKEMWSKPEVLFTCFIEYKFYQTSWFKGLVLFVSAMALVWITYYIFRRRNERILREQALQHQMNEIELKAVKAQINPHFIFNTLNAIQYYIAIGSGSEAEDYIALFSKFIRKTLDYSSKTSISLQEELEFVKDYFSIENKRFNNELVLNIKVSPDILVAEKEFPSMVLQPFIENAIKHGLAPSTNKVKKLDIEIDYEQNDLICKIIDNGIGIQISKELKLMGETLNESKGVALAKHKLSIFEKMSKRKSSITIIDTAEQAHSGTTIIIQIAREK